MVQQAIKARLGHSPTKARDIAHALKLPSELVYQELVRLYDKSEAFIVVDYSTEHPGRREPGWVGA